MSVNVPVRVQLEIEPCLAMNMSKQWSVETTGCVKSPDSIMDSFREIHGSVGAEPLSRIYCIQQRLLRQLQQPVFSPETVGGRGGRRGAAAVISSLIPRSRTGGPVENVNEIHEHGVTLSLTTWPATLKLRLQVNSIVFGGAGIC